MNISLNPEHEEFIKFQMEKGKYTSALEVISAAFKVLAENERLQDELHSIKYKKQIFLEDSNNTIRDFMKISESALNEYWLNEEEDEAWKNL